VIGKQTPEVVPAVQISPNEPGPVNTIAANIEELDVGLFSFLEAQTSDWDRRALLAFHAAAADVCGDFAYLEVGSYLGGSLQAVMRDPRCRHVMSLDPRMTVAPDSRDGGAWTYDDNTTDHMRELLAALPDVDMSKLTTFDTGTDGLTPSELPVRPTYCFVDGEHTPDAVIRDARFCAEAMGGAGVIAFHDYTIVGSGISAFLRENWRDITFALAFTASGVFAIEMGDRGLLKHAAIQRALGSRWHNAAWSAANRSHRTALPVLLVWAAIPAIDAFVFQFRHGLQEYVKPRA
jgi:hypothetical protein